MDPDTEIQTDCTPLFLQYKSGRVERLLRSDSVPAGLDPSTGVTSKDITINSTTSARLYLPKATTTKKLPILVYFHGGGFVVGSAFSLTYHPFLTSLTSKSQSLVISVDYRLAPEHPLPAAYDDSWSAINWAFSASADPWIVRYGDLDRVFVAGDSAGANISHHMAMGAEAKSVSRLEGIILIHAYFWGSEPLGSETRDPSTRGWMARLWKAVSSTDNLDDPRLNPMAVSAPSLRGMGCRRVMVCVASEDVMVERGRAYYEAVKRSGWGGEAELVETEGEGHVFHLETPDCERAAELVDGISGFIMKGVKENHAKSTC